MGLRVRVLGQVGLETSAGVFEVVASPRPRRLLALLASRHGSIVDDDVLAEAIWGDLRTPTERTALQTHMSTLRDLLEPGRLRRSPGSYIGRVGNGYVLASEAVDVCAFEVAVQRARAVHAADPATAVRLLEEALALWGDPPFGEFSDEPWAQGVVTRLRDVHATTLESRFGLALDEGTESTLIERMETAVTAHPYRERLAGQLMLAQYRAGHQQRALDQYAAVRRVLLDDLGLDPGRELQLLERAILAQDPSLRRRGRAETGRSPTAAPARRDPLPIVGRDGEIRDVAKLLERSRCVSIVGPGGIGKTALAVWVAHTLRSLYVDRTHHVDLATLGRRDVIRSVASTVRVVEHPLAPLADSVVDALGDEPALLLLETCEIDLDAAADTVTSLLRAPGLTVLVTSQAPLHIRGEQVFRLGPLRREPALALLTRGRARDDDRATLVAIADRVERIPLALELASARLDQLGARELLRELTKSDAALSGGSDRPSRHRSARAAAEWSVGLLSDELRRLLIRLAGFVAPFTVGAAAHVVAPPELPDDRAENGLRLRLGELVDRSLVVRIGVDPTRFRIPDTVRAVAAERSPAEVDAARTAIAEAVLAAAQHRLLGSRTNGGGNLDDLAGEVIAALDRFADLGDHRQIALAGLLGTFFVESGRISEGREQLSEALERHPDAAEVARVLTTAQLGFLAWYQGDLRGTLDALAEIRDRLDRVPSPDFVDTASGCIAFVERRFDDAAELLGRAADAIPARLRQKMLVTNMAGNASWYAGDLAGAARRYRSQRELARVAGDQFQLAQGLRFEAMVAAQLGDVESAWRWAERSLAMAHAMADPVSLAQSSAAIAVVTMAAQAEPDATRHAADALDAARRHFDVFALRTSVPIVATVALRRDDPVTAARLLGWFVDLLELTGQTASPATGQLADAAAAEARRLLGNTGFARESARGATMTLVAVSEVARLIADSSGRTESGERERSLQPVEASTPWTSSARGHRSVE